jgi:hypothetical protein
MLCAAGCGVQRPDYASLDLCDVTGVVRLDNAPLVGATVRFENENGTFSEGVTDSSGRYRLMYNSEQPGIAHGSKVVRIRSQRELDGETQGTELIDARYNVESKLRAEVRSRSGRFNFDLKSGPVAIGFE